MSKSNINDIFEVIKHGVAHRGLHDDKLPENSKAAFKAAIEKGLPFETDVHLTLDNQLIINHDNDLERVTGKPGVIEELRYFDIRNNYRLKDGSQLMSLEELLDMTNERVPMVLELKAYKGNAKALFNRINPVLERMIKDDKLVLISFDPDALREFKDTRWNCGLLVGGGEINTMGDTHEFDFLDVAYPLLQDPRFLAYRKEGHKIMAWTPRTPEQVKEAKPYSDALTFELIDPKLVY
jgi:glycerophosphoryl diester phosphodiesterase